VVEDRIVLSDLRFWGRHGVSAAERASPQEFAVEIECPTDASLAASRDDIAATLDYRRLADLARGVIEGPPRQLVETLADTIAERALADLGLAWVRVRVTKVRPGSLTGPAAVEVRRIARGSPSH
jgi:7,8-dihydroneopterin aldolase/epimerase/oxygenase